MKDSRFGALVIKATPFVLAFLGFVVPVIYLHSEASGVANHPRVLRVLSYSAFLNKWGPGPEIARQFKESTGISIEYLNAGDAGLILKKLELFPSDVVVGLDDLHLPMARAHAKWRQPRAVSQSGLRFGPREEFIGYDGAPLTFVYREGEIEPPHSLEDLLDARFRGTIALQDPRTSTPGLQFFFWVLDEMGVEDGFAYLEKLRANLRIVGASWSQAYGAFTKKQAHLVFSYLTSPVYHWTQENDLKYKSSVFSAKHPWQIEYAGIPESCGECEAAQTFLDFLLSLKAQKIIMEKNFMFPTRAEATQGTPFAELLSRVDQAREWKNLNELLERREELFERWRRLGL